MTQRIGITGLILAGGQSRRMSPAFAGAGGDKGLLDLGGKPMLGHVIERLSPQVGRLVLNANGDPSRFGALGLPVVADSVVGFAGPLAGVLAGMRWSAAHAPHATHVASVSADAPFLPGDLVSRLSAALEPAGGSSRDRFSSLRGDDEKSPRIALASSGGELHPVIGLWPVDLADDLEGALAAGVRKVLAWTDRHGIVAVEFPFVGMHGRSVDPFFNANTPEELEEARHLLLKA